jgi:hypothetical protein
MTIGKADQNERAVYPARTNAEKPPVEIQGARRLRFSEYRADSQQAATHRRRNAPDEENDHDSIRKSKRPEQQP